MINDKFKEFYSDVYKSQGNLNREHIEEFFGGLHLPHLTEEAISALDADLTLKELNATIFVIRHFRLTKLQVLMALVGLVGLMQLK